jgi:hypothetical protein
MDNIIGDIELKKKLTSIYIDDEFNRRVSKRAMKSMKDWSPLLMLAWLNWCLNSKSRENALSNIKMNFLYIWWFFQKKMWTLKDLSPSLTRPKVPRYYLQWLSHARGDKNAVFEQLHHDRTPKVVEVGVWSRRKEVALSKS